VIASVQSDAIDAVVTGERGSGSPRVLHAVDQLREVSNVVLLGWLRSSALFLTYVAPVPSRPALRSELRDLDAGYRLRVAAVDSHLSPSMREAWATFLAGPTVRSLDAAVLRTLDGRDPAPRASAPLSELSTTGLSIFDYNRAVSTLLKRAVDEGTAAAAADRRTAAHRAWFTALLAALLLLLTTSVVGMLGWQLRRRLGSLADAARRLSSGQLRPMRVYGPREVAQASTGLNDAVASLQRIAATTERLAVGDLSAPELRRPTPGPLGAAVHASVVMLADAIRERERLQRELRHQAAHDTLTGLPNRAEAARLLQAALTDAAMADQSEGRTRRIGVLFVDLDHFKQVNDTYGHPAGDHVLRVCAGRMAAEVRGGDTVCRLGGDEFVVILDQVESDEAVTTIGDRIVEAVSRPIAYQGHELQVGASIGVAVTDGTEGVGGPDGVENLLARADHAVYRAKAGGRNQLAY
jgi:diguanylate cyclase (GGDEF)-like protein